MLSKKERQCKRIIDFIGAFLGLIVTGIPILILLVWASIDNREFGLFCQKRIGQNAKPFTIFKIKTQSSQSKLNVNQPIEYSSFSRFLKAFHLDELPQLYNVLIGDMSLVGPRPDLPGYADALTGEDRKILSLKPGITGPATLKYRNEDTILRLQKNPEEYNRQVIWKDKVKINQEYLNNWSFSLDLQLILKTLFY